MVVRTGAARQAVPGPGSYGVGPRAALRFAHGLRTALARPGTPRRNSLRLRLRSNSRRESDVETGFAPRGGARAPRAAAAPAATEITPPRHRLPRGARLCLIGEGVHGRPAHRQLPSYPTRPRNRMSLVQPTCSSQSPRGQTPLKSVGQGPWRGRPALDGSDVRGPRRSSMKQGLSGRGRRCLDRAISVTAGAAAVRPARARRRRAEFV